MKFEIGEVCEVYVRTEGIWVDCEINSYITAENAGCCQDPTDEYVVTVPSHVSENLDHLWTTIEVHLRKKKPPEEGASWEKVQELINWNPMKEMVI
jgi:hypothetical protein